MWRSLAASLRGWRTVVCWGGLSVLAGGELRAQVAPVLLKGHSETVYDGAFLPNGQQVVTASFDRTLKLWDLATQKSVRTMEGHTGIVLTVAVSADGKLLASGGNDNSIRLWDVPINSALQSIAAHDAPGTAVAITPDGKTIATSDSSGVIKSWDAESGAMKWQVKQPFAVSRLDWRKDGQQLAAASPTGRIWLLAVADGATQASFGAHPGEITGLAFNPGNQLYSSGADGVVRRWPVQVNPTAVANGHQDRLNGVAVNPNGSTIATAGEDKVAKIFNRDGNAARQLDGHGGAVTAITYNRNAVHVATGCADKIARVFDGNSAQLVKALPAMPGVITSVEFSPDTARLLVADDAGNVKLFQWNDAMELKSFAGHAGAVKAVAFWSNGTQVITVGVDKTVRLWSVDSAQVVRKWDLDVPATAVALASNDTVLAVGTQDGSVRLFNPADGAELGRLLGHTGEITSVEVRADAQQIATSSLDGTARVWDVATKLPRQFLLSHSGPVSRVRFHPDNNHVITASHDKTARIEPLTVQLVKVADEKRINSLAVASNSAWFATAGDDGSVKMWNTGDGSPIRAYAGFQGPALSVAFKNDSQQIAAGGKDKSIRTWNANSAQALLKFEASSEVQQLSYSPDGSKLIAGLSDKSLPCFDPTPVNPQPAEPPSREAAQTLSGHAEAIAGLVWSPDNKTLRTISADKTLKVWSVAAVGATAVLTGHGAPVYGVAFSPDGKTLASGSNDKTVRLWDVEKKQPLKQLPAFQGAVNSVAYAPDGKLIAIAVADNTVRLLDAATGNEVRKLDGPTHPVYSVSFSRDGNLIAAAGMGIGAQRPVFVWQKDNPAPVAVLTGHRDDIYRVQFNPAGNRVLSIGYSGALKVWDHAAKKPVFETALGVVSYSATLSADGSRVLTGANDRVARILELPAAAR